MSEWRRDFEEARHGFSGDLLWDEKLSQHTYYRIGGPAELLAVPRSVEDLKWLATLMQPGGAAAGLPYIFLGLGSNVLASDERYRGIVIKLTRLNLSIEFDESSGALFTGASVPISMLLRKAAQNGWEGLDFLAGVPGSVGGAVFMNAGTHLGESGDRVSSVEYFDFNEPQAGVKTVPQEQLKYSYRKNHFLASSQVVCSATWKSGLVEPEVVRNQIQEVLTRRKSTQPLDAPSCGSVFKNPRDSGMHAWQVIEKLGLRGYRAGGACFSEKHCNFIVNANQARAADVRALIALAKSRALSELGIHLEEEVRYVGEWGDNG